MFESLFAFIAPIAKDIILAAAAALLTYAINKIQSQFNFN